MYWIFTYIWATFGENVGKYSMHGAPGYAICRKLYLILLQMPSWQFVLARLWWHRHESVNDALVERIIPSWPCFRGWMVYNRCVKVLLDHKNELFPICTLWLCTLLVGLIFQSFQIIWGLLIIRSSPNHLRFRWHLNHLHPLDRISPF